LQRKLVIHKIPAARKYEANPESSKKVYRLVVDYCQNPSYPWYGERQPGETYYYPHVNVYCLGIVNVADITVNANGEPDAKLHAHLYSKGQGDGHKGGNNVASLIMKQLEEFGWLKDLKDGSAELNIVFENCTGQNKNNMVFQLVPYLVENNFFREVNFNFLVAGHTKNIADRMFNTLKSVFRKSQIWHLKLMYKVLASRTCKIHPYEEQDFKRYGDCFDIFYDKYKRVKKYHIFTYKREDINAGSIMVSTKEFDSNNA